MWHVESSSSEQSLVSACECGLSGSQTPMPLHHKMLCSGICPPVVSRTIHGAQSRVRQGKVWAYNPRHVVILTVFMDQFRQLALGSHSYVPMSSWISFTVQLGTQSSFCFMITIDLFIQIFLSVYSEIMVQTVLWDL